MGNGDESSNDGWNYRGRGPLQTTGKDDYQSLANYAGIALEAVGDWLKTPEGGATATCWEWTRGNLNSYADTWNLHDMTRIINGGYTNLQDRISLCNKALGVFS
jgi:putative chitinase